MATTRPFRGGPRTIVIVAAACAVLLSMVAVSGLAAADDVDAGPLAVIAPAGALLTDRCVVRYGRNDSLAQLLPSCPL
jgi:hypothetical protein